MEVVDPLHAYLPPSAPLLSLFLSLSLKEDAEEETNLGRRRKGGEEFLFVRQEEEDKRGQSGGACGPHTPYWCAQGLGCVGPVGHPLAQPMALALLSSKNSKVDFFCRTRVY